MIGGGAGGGRATRTSTRGQSLVEFAVVMPVFLIILMTMLEFGLVFSERLTMGNATREGARVGAAMATGMSGSCSGDPGGVDTTVVAAVQNILRSGGSDVDLSGIERILIFRATASGSPDMSRINSWTYTPGMGPDADPGPDVETLDFSPASVSWPACTRRNTLSATDSIGVRVEYRYRLKTPLGGLLELVGGSHAATLPITDSTVMALNPTN